MISYLVLSLQIINYRSYFQGTFPNLRFEGPNPESDVCKAVRSLRFKMSYVTYLVYLDTLFSLFQFRIDLANKETFRPRLLQRGNSPSQELRTKEYKLRRNVGVTSTPPSRIRTHDHSVRAVPHSDRTTTVIGAYIQFLPIFPNTFGNTEMDIHSRNLSSILRSCSDIFSNFIDLTFVLSALRTRYVV
jgi:hypothetical protein